MGMWEKIKLSFDILYITDINEIIMLFFYKIQILANDKVLTTVDTNAMQYIDSHMIFSCFTKLRWMIQFCKRHFFNDSDPQNNRSGALVNTC